MSDEQSPDAAETASASAVETEAGATTPDLPEEWKPEPRQWGWKDVFTAPMLAFKPKCMAIAVITALALLGWGWLAGKIGGQIGGIHIIGEVWTWANIAINAVIFAIGATFISIFFKADLLEDEFLSCKEAFVIGKGRLGSAIMVPLFLVVVVAGTQFLLWIAHLVAAVPIVGSILYALLYPLGFLLGLLIVLLSIGAVLAIFVGPAVIAVRKHGWFDNVIDTFEAVGTKPHKLLFCLALTLVMMQIGFSIPRTAMEVTAGPGLGKNVYSNEVAKVEVGAGEISSSYLPALFHLGPLALIDSRMASELTFGGSSTAYRAQWVLQEGAEQTITSLEEENAKLGEEIGKLTSKDSQDALRKEVDANRKEISEIRENPAAVSGYHKWGPGLILHFWQVLLGAAILGYAINVLLAGGMLTYLAVREDDYWDDEDLEDLDKLTKELEEEAKREEEAAKADAAPAGETPAEAAKPVEETKADDDDKPDDTAKADDKPDEAAEKPQDADAKADEPAAEDAKADDSGDQPDEEKKD